MAQIQRILDLLSFILMVIGAVAIVAMMLQVMADVTFRYIFAAPIPGTEEIVSAYYMTAVVFLPLAYVQRERGHVIIELFTLWMSERAKAWLDGFVLLACAVALGIFTYASWTRALGMTLRQEIWIGLIDVIIWPSRWFLVAGLGLMTLYLILQSLREFMFAIRGHDHHQPPAHAEDSERI